MRTYPEYKDSGVEWIGEIPKYWDRQRLKSVSQHIVEKRFPTAGDIRISPENVESDTGRVLDFFSDYDSEGLEFISGDILFNKLRVYLNKVLLTKFTGLSMGEMIVIRPRGIRSEYLSKVMTSKTFIDEINSLSEGVKLPRPPVEGIMNSFVPVPPFDEQEQISDYLDQKTEQIDSLLEKIEKKLEFLKEQRASLINQCVTKGLDPDVEMKDSGVEWIGEIPKYWDRQRLKSVSQHIVEKRFPIAGDIRISPENVESDTGRVLDFFSDYDSEGLEFISGDILFNKLRVYLNKVLLTKFTGLSMGEMIVIRPRGIRSEYLSKVMTSKTFIDEINSLSEGVKLPRPPVEGIMNSFVPVPPFDEQEQISDYLDQETSGIDRMVATESRRMELLKEYRQSLISSVVTGKIRVSEDMP